MTTEEFITKARAIHGDKYDYSKVEYVNNKTKVCIICPEHGEFWQTPNGHLGNKGCRKCGTLQATKKMQKWDKESCFEEAKKYIRKVDFERKSPYAYVKANRKKWIKDYIWFIQERHKPWTPKTCVLEAKKYKSIFDFRTQSNSAYTCALKNGWIKEYTWLIPKTHGKWTYEECLDIARKYKTKKDFKQANYGAYIVANKHHWMQDFYWLTDKRLSIFSGKIDCVYAYFFKESNAVYIGRTIRPVDRDKEHIFNTDTDTVAKFAKKHNCKVPPMQILEENLTVEQGLEREDYWIKYYQSIGYQIINIAKTGVGTGSLGAIGFNKWNKKTCYKEALKYKSRSEFSDGNASAYGVARKNNWLDDYKWLKEPLSRLEDCWTKEECFAEARKYRTKTEFLKQNYSAYRLAIKNKWLCEMPWFTRPIVHNKKWTRETCKKLAKECSSISDFKNHSANAYKVAKKEGWLDTYTWFISKQRPSGYWTCEKCKEVALKCHSKKEFKETNGSAYNVAVKNKWINSYDWFIDTNSLLSRPRKWTEETCRQEAEKYSSLFDFESKSASACQTARLHGWLESYTWLKRKKKPNGFWNYERCKQEAARNINRHTFLKSNPAAFDASQKHGWLDDFFPN